MLRDALRTVEDGTADPVEQAEGDYPVAEKIRVNDAHIDFSAPVEAVDLRFARARRIPGHGPNWMQTGSGSTMGCPRCTCCGRTRPI